MREGVSPPVMAPMHDAARAVQFIRSKTAEWRIDPEQLAVAGRSAGGCTSLWLDFHDDLAELIEKISPHALVSPGDPPVYLFYRHAPALGQPVDDPTHSATFGVKLEVGVTCEVVHPETANPVHADVATFLIKSLRL